MSMKLKSTLLIVFSVLCVSLWGYFFSVVIGQTNSQSIAQYIVLEKTDRILLWKDSNRSVVESKEIGESFTVHSNLNSSSLTIINDIIEVGDAISYGNGVSIDELLKFFNINE
ncbi:hypothetical protein ACERII_02725 [Evansella sp. AB-rgal1]|uniref:hypothetical protein n=1 Tax=Evansella sp. AB-rgal1 TaxID=3242696 RepID=UPI00359F0BD6